MKKRILGLLDWLNDNAGFLAAILVALLVLVAALRTPVPPNPQVMHWIHQAAREAARRQ